MAISIGLLIALIIISIPLIIFIMKAEKYAAYVDAIDKDDFFGAQLFGIGFACIEMLKIDFSTDSAVKIRSEAGILFGKRYGDFYLRVNYAQRFTFLVLFIYGALLFGCFSGGVEGLSIAVLGIIAAIVIFVSYAGNYEDRLEKLNYSYMRDFPSAVSTIALLVNAGMFLRDAWKQVAYSADRPLYMQMRLVAEDMNNGISEGDAIFAFANRCGTKEIRKFCTLIIQAIEKGGRDLTDSLTKQSDLLIIEKRELALQQGEKASNKLMMPIGMIFLGILVMIMMPILGNMSAA
ncbi:MAG: type II secretion system F family protein [Ruminococcus sp.]|nr:type II secretion system F family protein [Ruminococcus sp.]